MAVGCWLFYTALLTEISIRLSARRLSDMEVELDKCSRLKDGKT